jgi:glycosyltransferase involved in cell wall biosynthesis
MKNSPQWHPHPKRILLIAPFPAPFIEVDIQIISKFAAVKPLIKSGTRAIFSILWNMVSCDVIFCWFGSVYTAVSVLLSKIFGKRSIVVLGGVDAAALPEINYGIWLNPWKSRLLTHGLRNADLILVVAPSMKDKIKQFAYYDGANIEYLPTGYDTDFWKPRDVPRERFVLTVGHSDSETRLKKKGLDYFCQAAERMPETRFVIIGIERALLQSAGVSVPANVEMLSKMPQEELRHYYQRCKVFCQPSRSEGMPNTLCEAMACGCIPVGTDVDGIPTAIGGTGFIATLGDIDALVDSLKKALKANEALGLQARQRIIKEFPIERRIKGLRKAVSGEW